MVKYFIILLLIITHAWAQDREFCEKQLTPGSIKWRIIEEGSQLSFRNQGGLIGGGVCWWHSRFTRNAAYLASFRPDLPKPTQLEARNLISRIRLGRSLVEVPGYRNLAEFSKDYSRDIISSLESWQRRDGILRQHWVIGLAGGSEVHPDRLSWLMDQLYQEVAVNQDVVYQKLQMEGIMAHAWLVLGMVKNSDGYSLFVLDSNRPFYIEEYQYKNGMTHFIYPYTGTKFVPYIGQAKELGRIKSVLKSNCQ